MIIIWFLFFGNDFASPEHVQEMLYLRCSELALSNGFKFFQVINFREGYEGHSYQFVQISKHYTFTNTIKFVDKPVAGKLAYDAYAIYHKHKARLAAEN